MQDDIDINVGIVILSAMRKESYNEGYIYGFSGLLTRFLKGHDVEEEAIYYRLVVDMRSINVTRTCKLDMAHRIVLTLPELHARNDEIAIHMYGLLMLQLIVGSRPVTREQIHGVKLDYSLDHYARTLLWIGPNFVEPVDDDIPTDEERQIRNLDIESGKDEVVDPNLGVEAYSPNDDMDEA